MEKVKNTRAIAVVATALFIASLLWLLYTKSANHSLEAGLKGEKLRSEELLSEKLLLEKEIQKFSDQLFKLKDENADLDDLVKSTTSKLQEQESEYNRMKRENVSLNQIRKQRQELQSLKSQLENDLTSLRTSYATLETKNAELNNTIASLQERNKLLTDDLNRAMFAAVDQSQVHAVRGNTDKLTIMARRTKKLIANFVVPSNLKSLSFRITDSKGVILTSEEGTIAFTSVPSERSLTASSDAGPEGNKQQKVEMVYLPKQKLRSGVYVVEILSENLYVGSLKIKLK